MKIREPYRKSKAVRWLILSRGGDHRKIARNFVLQSGRRIAPELEALASVEGALVHHIDRLQAVMEAPST